MSILLDGRKTARAVRDELRVRLEALASRGIEPRLALVRVGDDPASESYVRGKARACKKLGMASELHALPASTESPALESLVAELNGRSDVHGILVQLPLPDHLDPDRIVAMLDPTKDVDGLSPVSIGMMTLGTGGFAPCTPLGIQRLLVQYDIAIPGAHVVVLGRSNLVGRPLATLLSRKGPHADATVTLCHSRTRDLPAIARSADILVAAIGRPRFVTAEMVADDAVVVDVGIHRVETPDGEGLTGDVAFDEVVPRVRAITPVPGGVGPMTVAMLLANTVRAAEHAVR
jgi:methylenetetrahydrofolate dehydrogenase (NADP+)/methenyltetrahydrofolate cyclohydrolase